MLEDLVRLHKALADETRLRALYLLTEIGELCVCDLEAALGITQSRASRHLVALKRAGLLTDRRDGTWVYYRVREDLDPAARSALAQVVAALAGETMARADLERARTNRRSPTCRPSRANEPPESP